MKLIPYPVINAYVKSLNVAPTPVTNPYHLPLLSVRCIHNTPTGPNGADTTIPIIIPLYNMSIVDIIMQRWDFFLKVPSCKYVFYYLYFVFYPKGKLIPIAILALIRLTGIN